MKGTGLGGIWKEGLDEIRQKKGVWALCSKRYWAANKPVTGTFAERSSSEKLMSDDDLLTS